MSKFFHKDADADDSNNSTFSSKTTKLKMKVQCKEVGRDWFPAKGTFILHPNVGNTCKT